MGAFASGVVAERPALEPDGGVGLAEVLVSVGDGLPVPELVDVVGLAVALMPVGDGLSDPEFGGVGLGLAVPFAAFAVEVFWPVSDVVAALDRADEDEVGFCVPDLPACSPSAVGEGVSGVSVPPYWPESLPGCPAPAAGVGSVFVLVGGDRCPEVAAGGGVGLGVPALRGGSVWLGGMLAGGGVGLGVPGPPECVAPSPADEAGPADETFPAVPVAALVVTVLREAGPGVTVLCELCFVVTVLCEPDAWEVAPCAPVAGAGLLCVPGPAAGLLCAAGAFRAPA
ncbi:hypothetical protein [Actinoplanes flavus]|uniref:Uncharacterized protein n=1 Tax=Actinoplanes flavus TaxID=2820290 RepID=A0ABS3UGY2_9ACTN|nr:hypothetical protein [Actinoplanes flavus]MBO3738029.1 hypothetical protein [Actinoplanes flavus]